MRPHAATTFLRPSTSTLAAAFLMRDAHAANTSAFLSRPLKCKHISREPAWTSETWFVKNRARASAISSAVGGAASVGSGHSRLRSGLMSTVGSDFSGAIVGRAAHRLAAVR